MMGLMALGALVIYLLVSIWVTRKASNWAKANNKKPWLWGGLAAFVMYNLVFWDLIPTLVMHKYYCATQAGFWVYKTPEQWMKENPELTAEDLKPFSKDVNEMPHEVLNAGTSNAITITKINKRIFKAFDTEKFGDLIPLKKSVNYFYDSKSDKRIAEFINFVSGYGNPMTTGKGLSAWKFWLRDNCYNREGDVLELVGFNNYFVSIVNLGEDK